ncbi:MAG TPA: AAA family ATPase [Actinomycetota bacterium]
MQEVARIVLALDSPDVAEEVLHFLDRTGRARVVGTASDPTQLAAAVRQLEPDAVVAAPSFTGVRGSLNGSPLFVVDTAQSVSTLRRAIGAGAAGFFLWPAEREELALAASRAHPRLHEHGVPAPVIAVYGPRGGAGATFVSTHLARAFARRERRCVLVDLDAVFGDVAAAVGAPADGDVRTIADLAPLGDEIDSRHVEEVAWRHSSGFDVVLAPGLERSFVSADAALYRATIAAARQTCEVVVLHLPRALDEVTRAGLDVADRGLIVLGLDVFSFRDASRALQMVDLDDRVAFVVNRAGRSELAPADVERVFGRKALAVIPSDRRVGPAQDHGRLLPMRGRLGRSLDRLATGVLDGLGSGGERR